MFWRTLQTLRFTPVGPPVDPLLEEDVLTFYSLNYDNGMLINDNNQYSIWIMFFKSQIKNTSMGQDCDTLLKLQYHRTDSWQCFGPNIIVKDAAIKTKKSLFIFKVKSRHCPWSRGTVASGIHISLSLVSCSFVTLNKKHQQFLMSLSSTSNLDPLLSLNPCPSKARRTPQ